MVKGAERVQAQTITAAQAAWNAAKVGTMKSAVALYNLRSNSIMQKGFKTGIGFALQPEVQQTLIKPGIMETALSIYLGGITAGTGSAIVALADTWDNLKELVVNNPILQAGKAAYENMTKK